MRIVLQAWHRVVHSHTCYCAIWVSDTKESSPISWTVTFENANSIWIYKHNFWLEQRYNFIKLTFKANLPVEWIDAVERVYDVVGVFLPYIFDICFNGKS